jgi:hypothetical protein
MTYEKMPPIVIGALLLIAGAAWGSKLYSVPDPWSSYNAAVRGYLAAGVRGDSTLLASQAASPQPVAWVRRVKQQEPAMLAAWALGLSGVTGERHGDTVGVVLNANDVEGCIHTNSVVALLLNHSAAPRLLAISSPCLDQRPLQVLQPRMALPH